VFRIASITPLVVEMLGGYRFDAAADLDLNLDIVHAVEAGTAWWVPARANAGRATEAFQLWKVTVNSNVTSAWIPLLVGEVRAVNQGAPLDRYEPSVFKVYPLTNGAVVFGYENDSLYVLQPAQTQPSVVFHPARKGLQLLDLGSGLIGFWTLHARKLYLVETVQKEKSR
jgi:hypothetical protein